MLRTSDLLSVCCGCPAEAGLHRCRRHPMVVETLVSPNATRSQQCTQMPQTNVERSFSPICVHSYCVFPCGRARRPRLAGPGTTPPAAWWGVARAHLPSWATFHSAPQAGGGGALHAPRAATSRKGAFCATRRPQTAPFRKASGGMRPSARPRGPPPQPRRCPPQVGPGNRCAPAAARDVAADARPHPRE